MSSSLWCDNALLVPFRAILLQVMINGRLFDHLPSWSGAFYLWLVWHISLFLSCLKSPKQDSCLKSRRTGLWRLEVFAEVQLWRRYPLVEILFYIDIFKSCTLRRHLWFRTLDVSFSFCWECLVSTLQMQRHCIHVAFERGCQGLKVHTIERQNTYNKQGGNFHGIKKIAV